MSRCDRCQAEVDPAELREFGGQQLCEDCYMDALSPARACDPWAVHSARSTIATQGQQLTPLQQQIYDLVRAEQEISFVAAAARLGIKEEELRREFATLRHMELLRAARREHDLVIIPF